mgnify:CR=1 FL=1
MEGFSGDVSTPRVDAARLRLFDIDGEKHSIDGGKTVAQLRYTLKKFYEDHPDADDDPAGAPASSPAA